MAKNKPGIKRNVDVKKLQLGQGAPFSQPSDRKLPGMSNLKPVSASSFGKKAKR